MRAPMFRDALASSRQSGTPLLAFNIVDLASSQGVIDAAEKTGMATILQCSSRTVTFYGPRVLRDMVNAAADGKAAFLHLDHCRDDTVLDAAISAGFDGIMADGSHLGPEDNVKWTGAWARKAHAAGVVIEGEITAIVGAEDGIASGARATTTPEEFVEFARDTGVDLLGADIGTAHGLYQAAPVVDFDLIDAVRGAPAGFVVHGGSGLDGPTLAGLARAGAIKINFSTELKMAWAAPLIGAPPGSVPEPVTMLRQAREAVRRLALEKFALVRGEG